MQNITPKHDKIWYLERVRDTLEEIKMTPGDQYERFKILKKQAQKCLERARECERLEKTPST